MPHAARPANAIATLKEGPLHAALKAWYSQAGDRIEVPVDGRQIDIVRGDLLIEIQTRNFTALRRKLESLVGEHRVRIVHPVAVEKWIVRIDRETGEILGRRRSPRAGRLEDAFAQFVGVAKLLGHPNVSCEVVLTREEEVRAKGIARAWRRKGWAIVERRLIDVLESRLLSGPRDLCALLPPDLPDPFTTADLSRCSPMTSRLAQQMAYCLRESGAITAQGKRGNAHVYGISFSPSRRDRRGTP